MARRRESRRAAFEIGGQSIAAGRRATVSIPFGMLSNHMPMALTVHVVHGRTEGPRLFVSAALHGDEVNGVEIIRRLLASRLMERLHGTLIAAPIVNVHGFIGHSRYLPDRRDLNRSFPGNPNGSLASQLASLFMSEVVERCSHGIDLHTGSSHRNNFPQIRVQFDSPEQMELAQAFAAPVILDSKVRPGSLREAATEAGALMLLYEAGEALRFDELSIRVGVQGVFGVMKSIGMLKGRVATNKVSPYVADASTWVRSPGSGILRAVTARGTVVKEGEVLGTVSDPFGETELRVIAPEDGIVIGRTNLPVVNQGDALFHIALVGDHAEAARTVEQFEEEADEYADTDEPPIV